MTDTSRLPFSPLTHGEINRRVDELRGDIGGRVIAAYRAGDPFQRYDYDYFKQSVAAYDEHQAAALRRVVRPDTSSKAGAG